MLGLWWYLIQCVNVFVRLRLIAAVAPIWHKAVRRPLSDYFIVLQEIISVYTISSIAFFTGLLAIIDASEMICANISVLAKQRPVLLLLLHRMSQYHKHFDQGQCSYSNNALSPNRGGWECIIVYATNKAFTTYIYVQLQVYVWFLEFQTRRPISSESMQYYPHSQHSLNIPLNINYAPSSTSSRCRNAVNDNAISNLWDNG